MLHWSDESNSIAMFTVYYTVPEQSRVTKRVYINCI